MKCYCYQFKFYFKITFEKLWHIILLKTSSACNIKI